MLLRAGTEKKEYWFVFNGIDKVLHVSIFAVLGFLLVSAYPKIRFLYFIQIMLLYALVTEILQDQMQMGRSLENLDVVADMLGTIIGYWIYKSIKRPTL